MSNRILDVVVENGRLDPLQAEILVHVRPERLTPTTEVRGRLMGPSCPYASTLEIAHVLMPHRRDDGAGWITYRAVIPEASLWDPVSPFVYGGPVELWQDGQRLDRDQVRHGLRRFALAQSGLRINGKPFVLRAEQVAGLTPDDVPTLRGRGTNLLVTTLRPDILGMCDVADRFGFLLVARVGADFEAIPEPFNRALAAHPCCLGLLFEECWLPGMHNAPYRPGPDTLFGVLLTRIPDVPLPDVVDFVVAAGDDGEKLAGCGRPVLFALR